MKKIEALEDKKYALLMKRSFIFCSLLYNVFHLGRKKISIIDSEIDDIEREIITLKEPEFQKIKNETEALIKKTDQTILKCKMEIKTTQRRSSNEKND